MIVEIFGLPGSGKSTLAKKLSERTGLTVARLSLPERFRWWGIALLRAPLTTFGAIAFLFRHAGASLYRLFMNGCIDRHAKWEKAHHGGGIVDEGPLQNVLSFPRRKLSEEEAEAFVNEAPKSDIVIVVSASSEERKRRQASRGRIARDEAWESYAEENARRAVSSLEKAGRKVFTYPEKSLESLVGEIGL